MEITIQESKTEENYLYDVYTIYVGDHRILTVSTGNSAPAAEWLEGVHKNSRCSNTKRGTLVVGLSAERYPDLVANRTYWHGVKEADCQYNLLKLCVGSQCLLYELPDAKETRKKYGSYSRDERFPKILNDLLSSRNVVTAGIRMTSLAKDLERVNGITIANPVDLSVMAAKLLPVAEKLDLSRCYNLDVLAKAVLGQKMEVVHPKRAPVRFHRSGFETLLSEDHVKIGTLDSYLCFEIAYKLLDLADGNVPPEASSWTEKKTKNKKKSKRRSKS